MHSYGRWPDVRFYEVDLAAEYVGNFIARWGRISVHQTKEKFCTVRVYCHLGWDTLHAIIWPRRMWVHPLWPYRLDLLFCRCFQPILSLISDKLQPKIYRLAYKRAIKKWPHLKEEILCCADMGELLKGL